MTRGNQRELARVKNQKKQQEINRKKAANDKSSNKGMSLEQRKARDAELMREKQKKALGKEDTIYEISRALQNRFIIRTTTSYTTVHNLLNAAIKERANDACGLQGIEHWVTTELPGPSPVSEEAETPFPIKSPLPLTDPLSKNILEAPIISEYMALLRANQL
ncbi:hypothetical protein J437_LFUL008359 [Ladona fulva]|uniref:Small EDRK-rich factor-like N-terminal domain-containing protein n=1 Tax=Ladona fulva TaxID=123851 RepID=A0A8K0P0U1_LADFU|nr:hypothetical protein J437_LFUL008359 [Ladona fulva]